MVGRVRGLVQVAPPPAVAWAQRAMAARPDSRDVLASYDGPALVVVGEEDTISPPADAEAMAAGAAAGTARAASPKAGHLTAVETPEAFNDAVQGFLDELG